MWHRMAAVSLLFVGCASSADDGGQADNATNTDPTSGVPGGAGVALGGGGTSTVAGAGGSAGASTSVGSGGTGGGNLPMTGGTGGSSGSANKDGGAAGGVVVTVTPKSTAVMTGKSLQLSAVVTGTADMAVVWTLVESAGCGSVSASGNYTAPSAVPNPAYCHVKAASHADGTKSDTAALNIVATASTGQVGIWENVTPAGVSVDPNFVPNSNFGVQDVVADPVRPSDLYVGICYQGFWRSTDFGLTWKKVNTGTNGSVLDGGRPWSAEIDRNQGRDPSTPPALYTTDGYGSKNAVLKSTDWGVSWSIYQAGLSPYSFSMDPYDSQHLITGLHEADGIAESTDAGVTWKTIATSFGKSIYPHFIDTGAAASTRKTWLAVPQIDTGPAGMMTTDGGASFHSIGNFAHPHGGNQLFNAGGGVAYVGASGGGVWNTVDSGGSWKPINGSSGNGYANGVIGTASWLYAWDDGATFGIGGPDLYKAPRNPGTAWTAMTAPPAMNNGGKSMAATYDGTHYILLSGSWNAGLWRYVEP